MPRLRRLFSDWGIPACILSLWVVATIFTVRALMGMKAATMRFETRAAAARATDS